MFEARTTAPNPLKKNYLRSDGVIDASFWHDVFAEAAKQLKPNRVGTIKAPAPIAGMMNRIMLNSVAAEYPRIEYEVNFADGIIKVKLRGKCKSAVGTRVTNKGKK